MKRKTIFIVTIFSTILLFICCTRKSNFPVLRGDYLGQKPPGMTPEIFAPDIVSTGFSEFCSVFSKDGNTFYFSFSGAPFPTIAVMEQREGHWSEPFIPSFSGRYLDYDMNLTPDGKRLLFCSRRPLQGNGPPKDDTDFWVVEKTSDGWAEPEHLGFTINSDGQEYYPVFTNDGTMYFSSTRQGGLGGADIYRSRFRNGHYTTPENLGEPINSRFFEGDVYVSPDEAYMIVTCYGRSESLGSGDLYISFRKKDGSWTELSNMDSPVNSEANEHCPMVSPDGKVLFFSSGRSIHKSYSVTPITYQYKIQILNNPGNGRNEDIYWVDSRVIDSVKPEALK